MNENTDIPVTPAGLTAMFFMGRRDSTEIVYDILGLAQDDVSRTQIVHHANLNFQLAARYIAYLTARGVLQKRSGNSRAEKYRLTSKGEHLLNLLSELRQELYPTGLERGTSKGHPHSNYSPAPGSTDSPEINDADTDQDDELRDQLRKLRPLITHIAGFLVGMGLGYSLP